MFARFTRVSAFLFVACVLLAAEPAAGQAGPDAPRPSPPAPIASPAEAATGTPSDEAKILGDRSLIGLIRRGRWLMLPILLCSVVGLGFTVERIISLRRRVHIPPGLVQRVLERALAESPDAGVSAAQAKPSGLGRLLAAILMRAGVSRQEMAQAIDDESGRLQYDLRRNTRPIGMVATVAPLLGLLGTVVGMIRAFDRVAEVGLGRQAELAGGIAEALLTTGAGLTVAIPCYLLFHFFKGRGDDIVREVEDLAVGFNIEYQRRLGRDDSTPAEPAPAAVAAAPAPQDEKEGEG